jgi:ABC-type multidrug transport system ATPase subunit
MFHVVEHFILLLIKNVQQKRAQKWLDLLMQLLIPVVLFAIVLLPFTPPPPADKAFYARHALNPFVGSDFSVFNFNSLQGVYAIEGTILFSPDTHAGVQQLVKHLEANIPGSSKGWEFVGCSDHADCDAQMRKHFFSTVGRVSFNLTASQMSSGEFLESGGSQTIIDYTMSVGSLSSYPASYSFSNSAPVYNEDVASADTWAGAGFLTMQNMIDVYLGNLGAGVDDLSIDTYIQRYPKNPRDYFDSPTYDMASQRYSVWMWMAPIIFTVAFYYPMQTFSAEAVREGATKIHDLLEVSGISFFAYWASYIVMGLLVGIVVLLLAIALLSAALPIITPLTSGAYMRALLAFSMGIMAQCLALGRFFEQVEYFGLPVLLMQTILGVAGTFVANSKDITPALKGFIGLFSPPIGLANSIFGIETFQRRNPSATTFDFLWTEPSAQLPSVDASIAVLLLGTVLAFLFAWGYPFEWARLSRDSLVVLEGDEGDLQYPCDLEDEGISTSTSTSLPPVLLQSNNLTKIYPGTTRRAVADLSFQVREGEVLSFLGANGAGKSTTMAMLSGTSAPTRGDALIGGKSISLEKGAAKKNVGVCFQSDVIWSDLSVGFHLWFFGKVRGLWGRELDRAVTSMLESLGFPEKRDFLAGKLSGGQTRRLCVGLSMVGKNKVVYLDEPTAGLDPVSRRQLWDLIESNRAGRAILLTTHFMDEADILGDRIAVVKEGRMRACGSSKWLKGKFGIGYLLRCAMTIKKDASELQAAQQFVKRAVSAAVPEAELVSCAGTELSFRLPKEKSASFPALFEQLDGNTGAVTSYGVEATTLEEVFMEIVNEDVEHLAVVNKRGRAAKRGGGAASTGAAAAGTGEDEAPKFVIKGKKQTTDASSFTDSEVAAMLRPGRSQTDDCLACPEFGTLRQIIPMLVKRFKQMVRSKGQFTFLLVVPVFMAAVAGVIMHNFTYDVLLDAAPPAPLAEVFSTPYAVPVTSKHGQGYANDFASQAGLSSLAAGTTYVSGGTLHAMMKYLIDSSTNSPDNGVISSDSVYLESFSGTGGYNYTLFYNATNSLNFPAVMSKINRAAVLNATGGDIRIDHSIGMLPVLLLDKQVYPAFFLVMVVGLFHASIVSGICLVLGQEKINLVKHQQLSSGARTLAYWVSNFCVDYLTFIAGVIILATAFIFSGNPGYDNPGSFFFVAAVGIVYALAATFQAHCLSFFTPDIRLLQSSVFYGTAMRFFIFNTIFMSVFLTSRDQNLATSPDARIMLTVFGLIEPAFPFAYILLFKANLFGVVTQNDATAEAVASHYIGQLVLAVVVFMLLLFFLEAGEPITRKLYLFVMECGSGLKVSRKDDSRTSFAPDFYREGSDALSRGASSASTVAGRSVPLIQSEEGRSSSSSSPSASVASMEIEGTGATTTDIRSVAVSVKGPMTPGEDGEEEMEQEEEESDSPDVVLERRHVESLVARGQISRRQQAVFLAGLRKVYVGSGAAGKKKVAVRGMYLSVAQGEAFGLLGANGAGKTSLFKMMSGLEGISEGKAHINGIDVARSRSAAQRSLGLCPQFDTLIERLTVHENLLYFAKIKGLYSESAAKETVSLFMRAMDITRYQSMRVQQLSGGNRRRVSLIVALLGAPATLFLDEPSTGLDPVASRMMWNLLSRVRSTNNCALILTTHNMLECEAVCNRVGIMSAGRLVALGNCQHLRSIDGATYLLELNIDTAPNRSNDTAQSLASSAQRESISQEELTGLVEEVRRFVVATFPSASLLDDNVTQLSFELQAGDVASLSKTFGILETNKARLRLRDYNLSQATLEQTFLKKIRSGDAAELEEKDNTVGVRHRPRCSDYVYGVLFWFLSFVFPGALRFWLGDYANGVLFLFTYNEFIVGGVLDLFRLPELLELSISRYGHANDGCCPGCLRAAFCCSCCCGRRRSAEFDIAPPELIVEEEDNDNHQGSTDGTASPPAPTAAQIRRDTIPVAI